MPSPSLTSLLTGRSRAEWSDDSSGHQWTLAAIVLGAILIRVWHLAQPMRMDEATTVMDYALRPLAVVLSDYREPNNHILHSVFVWIFVHVLGDEPWVARMPAFIAGVALVPACYALARTLANRAAGIAAALLAAVMPSLVLYSTNARGYTMECLAFVLLLLLANAIAEEPTRRRLVAFAVVTALGAYTVPAMLYPAGVAVGWVVVERARRHRASAAIAILPSFSAALAFGVVLTAILYAPVIIRSGVSSVASNIYVAPMPWKRFVSTLPTFAWLLRDALVLGFSRVAIAGLAIAAVSPVAFRSADRARFTTLALCTGAWCALLLAAQRHAPPGRTWLFLVPLLCVFAGAGVSMIGARAAAMLRLQAERVAVALATTIALAVAVTEISGRVVFASDETVRFVAARDVASFIASGARPADRVILMPGTAPPIDYYLHKLGKGRVDDYTSEARQGRLLLVMNERYTPTPAAATALRGDVNWPSYEPLQLVQKFDGASVYSAEPRAPASQAQLK